MEKISKPSINRLARRAGVKSISEDCYDTIRNLIGMELTNIVKNVILINSHNQTKTIIRHIASQASVRRCPCCFQQ